MATCPRAMPWAVAILALRAKSKEQAFFSPKGDHHRLAQPEEPSIKFSQPEGLELQQTSTL